MKLPAHIKGVIFDLDGTLLDSLHVWRDVDIRFFAKRNLPMPNEYLHNVKVLDLYDAAIYTKTTFSLPERPEELVREWLDMVKEEYKFHVALKPYAKEFVESLTARGVKLGVATSSAEELFLPCLKRHGIARYFTAFTETKEAARGKEFPDPYLLAAQKIDAIPEHCAVFEDILVGVKSAKSGGFFTVAVADHYSAADEKALKKEADLFIRGFEELL